MVKAVTVNLRTSVISQEKEMGAKTESSGESQTYHLLLTLPTSLGRLALEL